MLRKVPNAGRSRDIDLRPGLRSFRSGKYVIFYRINPAALRIIRVLHGKRDVRTLLTDL
jgi:plasmid stabilization system protein ParE